jgi:hypothetical protein
MRMLSTGTTVGDNILHSFGTQPVPKELIAAKISQVIGSDRMALAGGWTIHSETELPLIAEQFIGDDMQTDTQNLAMMPGTRVELTGRPTAVTLRGRTGRIVREDDDDRDYVIVRLDTPALYHHFNGEVEELPEIVVMTDNLRALGH